MKRKLILQLGGAVLFLTAGIIYCTGIAPAYEETWYEVSETLEQAEKRLSDSVIAEADGSFGNRGKLTEADLSMGVRININSADASELTRLPGIGQSRAEAIISYREQNGLFKAPEDIMLVQGIKEGIYAGISRYICI